MISLDMILILTRMVKGILDDGESNSASMLSRQQCKRHRRL